MKNNLKTQIEAVLFFKNEPLSIKELSKFVGASTAEVEEAVKSLKEDYQDRGVVILDNGTEISLGTHPEVSGIIEKLEKDELSREIGRAGIETLSIILYRGPVSRKDIDYIRGVNSSFILRNLMIRGLIERADNEAGRGWSYKPTLELLRFLGVRNREELPEFETAFEKIKDFSKNPTPDAAE